MKDNSLRDHNPESSTAMEKITSARGREYWRSLDELADSAAFQEWLRGEFPSSALEALDGVSRRRFMQTMAASFALAGLTGCRDKAPENIVPYVHAQDRPVPGESSQFATALARSGYATGVLVKSVMGRPIKIEGNPDHPASLGATDVFTQAEILTLYDPDRSQAVHKGSDISTWENAQQVLDDLVAGLHENNGRGFRLLTGTVTSPTLLDQIGRMLEALPEARWHVHEPIDLSNARAGAEMVYGKGLDTVYRFDLADVIVSLDCDFLFALPGSVRYAREFADGRRVRHEAEGHARVAMNRLYAVEPSPTITGAKADHRLPMRAGRIEGFLWTLATELGLQLPPPPTDQQPAGEEVTKWIRVVAADLKRTEGRSLVAVGSSQPPHVHAMAHAINQHLGNLGRTVTLVEPLDRPQGKEPGTLEELSREMAEGGIESLIIVDTNPVYDAPADLGFAAALEKVPLSLHMGLYRDETGRSCRWHLPMAHLLESWSDARAFDGTSGIIQPLIEPLYQGRSPHMLMATLTDSPQDSDRTIVREFWKGRIGEEGFEEWWRDVVRRGVIRDSAAKAVEVHANQDGIRRSKAMPATQPASGSMELLLRPDPTIWDGRYANNGWMQECPKPLSTITWDNAALLSPATAARLGVGNEQVIEIEVLGRKSTAPVWIMPGQADDCVTLSLGYGRRAAGHVGSDIGVDAYALRRSDALWHRPGVVVRRTDRRYPLATTQNHHAMEGRDLIRGGTLEEFRKHPEEIAHEKGHSTRLSLYPERPYEGQQWGMSIDLTTCIGCNACTIACQAENNIALVGKEEVRRGREMHWIRVDTYFRGEPEDPEYLHQPVPCMHCEKAPCELVCPVGATTHSGDGLNEMTYNRCIGTRYCSNNCPYKVRRFNFLQYADKTTESIKLQRNPEVTVRARGVMEKCTYCVQRIRMAEIDASKESRPIRDGEVVTACQQVCPTQAIVFGDINDRDSKVTAAKNQPHDYGMLAELNTQPRTTYLAAVRNPNPELT